MASLPTRAKSWAAAALAALEDRGGPHAPKAFIGIMLTAGAFAVRWAYKGRKGTSSGSLADPKKSNKPVQLSVLQGVFPDTEKLVAHRGSCHCGAVRFVVRAPADLDAVECNCSMCTKKGCFPRLVVPSHGVDFESGLDSLSIYSFGTHTAKHMFCTTCGVHALNIPRSNPDCFDINLRCIDSNTIRSLVVHTFDGQHWEDSFQAAERAAAAAEAIRSSLRPAADVTDVHKPPPATSSSGSGSGSGRGAAAQHSSLSNGPTRMSSASVSSVPLSVASTQDEEAFVRSRMAEAISGRPTPPGVPEGAVYSGSAHSLLLAAGGPSSERSAPATATPRASSSVPAPTPVVVASPPSAAAAAAAAATARTAATPARAAAARTAAGGGKDRDRDAQSLPSTSSVTMGVRDVDLSSDSDSDELRLSVAAPSSDVARALQRDPSPLWRRRLSTSMNASGAGALGPGAYRTPASRRQPHTRRRDTPPSSGASNLWAAASHPGATPSGSMYVSAGGAGARPVPRHQRFTPAAAADTALPASVGGAPGGTGSPSARVSPAGVVVPRPSAVRRLSSAPSPTTPGSASSLPSAASGASAAFNGSAPPYSPFHHQPASHADTKPTRRTSSRVVVAGDGVDAAPGLPGASAASMPAAAMSQPAGSIGSGPHHKALPSRRKGVTAGGDATSPLQVSRAVDGVGDGKAV